jgi:hypothetical protein
MEQEDPGITPLEIVPMNAVAFSFSVDGVWSSTDYQGLLSRDGDHFYLEFQPLGTWTGLPKNPMKEVRIPLTDVASVSLSRRWFGMGCKLVIQLARTKAAEDLPCVNLGRIELRIARKNRGIARTFVSQLQAPDASGAQANSRERPGVADPGALPLQATVSDSPAAVGVAASHPLTGSNEAVTAISRFMFTKHLFEFLAALIAIIGAVVALVAWLR